jgi:hypothetical protein
VSSSRIPRPCAHLDTSPRARGDLHAGQVELSGVECVGEWGRGGRSGWRMDRSGEVERPTEEGAFAVDTAWVMGGSNWTSPVTQARAHTPHPCNPDRSLLALSAPATAVHVVLLWADWACTTLPRNALPNVTQYRVGGDSWPEWKHASGNSDRRSTYPLLSPDLLNDVRQTATRAEPVEPRSISSSTSLASLAACYVVYILGRLLFKQKLCRLV